MFSADQQILACAVASAAAGLEFFEKKERPQETRRMDAVALHVKTVRHKRHRSHGALAGGRQRCRRYYGDGQPWDDHSDINNHRNHARRSDRPIAALLQDLKSRGESSAAPGQSNAATARQFS